MTAVSAVVASVGLLVLVAAGPASPGGTSPLDPANGAASPIDGTSTTTSTTPTTTPTPTATASPEASGTTVAPSLPDTPAVSAVSAEVVIDPLPRSVTASASIVGAGGVVTFRGVCPTSSASTTERLFVVVVGPAGEQIAIDLDGAAWVFEWTAPVDPAKFGTHQFQFWCGDAPGREGEYPATLLRTVDMVAQEAAATTSSTSTVPADVLPATI